jgi:hypothetical protein
MGPGSSHPGRQIPRPGPRHSIGGWHPFESCDELTDIVDEVAEATGRRDEMASKLKRLITQRGDHVASVDLTFEL